MSAKRRLYQVAKQFNVSNDTLIQFLAKLNFDIRNHMSPVTDEMLDVVEKKYGGAPQASDADYEFRKRLKEKRVKEAEKAVEAQKELEKRLQAATQFMADRSTHQGRHDQFDDSIETEDVSIQDLKKAAKSGALKSDIEKSVRVKPEIEDEIQSRKIPGKAEPDEIHTRTVEVEAKAKISVPKTKIPTHPGGIEDKKIVEPEAGPADLTKSEERTPHPMPPEELTRHKKEPGKEERPTTPSEEMKRHGVTPPVAKPAEGEKPVAEEGEIRKRKRKRRRKKKVERVAPVIEVAEGETEEEPVFDEFDLKDKDKRKPLKKRREDEEAAKEKNRERNRKKKKKRKVQISEAEVDKSIKKTMASMEVGVRGRRRRKKVRDKDGEDVDDELENLLRINEFISVAELATAMEVEPSEVIKKCLELGMMVSINQRLDKDVLETVADEFGYQVEILPEYGHDLLEELEEEEEEDEITVQRPPVVTIMGHVDHGKTSLLDYIRESNVVAGESGGITQHIGAYEVNVNNKAITFLDTPGHEAFTAMRARGAQITDIVVLIVAADDAVMPQTIEAINHAQAAEVPIIVAINKIDKGNASVELIKRQLADQNVLIEEWGGKYQCAEISAKTGVGIPRLLELILLEAEVLELKANYERHASGVIIESRLDRGKGVVATILIQKGTLRVGAPFIVGQYFGKVRSMFNERNQRVEVTTPGTPVQVVGFSGIPGAGDTFTVLKSEKDTREISLKRQQIRREQEIRRTKHLTLDEISRRIKQGSVKELLLIVKGDVDGSIEPLSDSLNKLSNAEVAVKVIHKGVGAISESDVLLASASNAVVIGFHVRPTLKAREIAKRENVDIRLYTVIYDTINEVKSALEGMLEPESNEDVRGTIEVRQVFRVPKVGTIAGCHVVSGKVARNDKAKLYRNDKLIFDGKISSLRRFKEDIKEVTAGFECGIGFEGFQDIHENDIIEPYKIVQVKRTLASV